MKQVEVFLLWNWFKREYFKFVHKVTHRVTTNSRGWGVTEKSIFQNLWKKEIDGIKKDIKQIYNFLQKHGFTDLKVKILILNADPNLFLTRLSLKLMWAMLMTCCLETFYSLDFSRTAKLILTKLVTKHPKVKGIQVFLNKGLRPLFRGDNKELIVVNLLKLF